MGTNFEAANSENKSIRYGFDTAIFIVSVLGHTAHVFQGKRQHLMVHIDRTAVVQQQQILGTNFQKSVQSVRYGCLCTEIEGGCVGFLPVNFKHGNRGKR
jgi:hypothetical protein